MSEVDASANVREVWPLLIVRDAEASLRHYRDLLGFEVVGRAELGGRLLWCRLRRGAASVMLQRGGGRGADVSPAAPAVGLYFVCDDVDARHAELTAAGLAVESPTDADHPMRQMRVPDPDGHDIWFETPLEGRTGGGPRHPCTAP